VREVVETQIAIQKLNVFYGQSQALKDITVDIPKNKITAIIGPSGCGKSTLLKSLNRLVELVDGVRISGTVIVDGLNIFDKTVDVIEIRKKMGLIAQTPNPLPMSIFDNVAYGLRIHGMKDGEALNEAVESCLKASSLWSEVKDRLKDPTSKLSVGQQQRLCLARALAVKPEIILCDEATSALDPISAGRIETKLLALKKDYTVVFVTHVLRQARRLADYVVFLYMGELVEHGTAEALFTDPKNERTKAYLQGVFS
jgi:phosphate transport system ATP-binding protein